MSHRRREAHRQELLRLPQEQEEARQGGGDDRVGRRLAGLSGRHHLQLFPFEAMVKRTKGFNPEGNDWEFFQLVPEQKPNGKYKTKILAQSKAEVANPAGSCQGVTCGSRPSTTSSASS
jgi:hypothetical protein